MKRVIFAAIACFCLVSTAASAQDRAVRQAEPARMEAAPTTQPTTRPAERQAEEEETEATLEESEMDHAAMENPVFVGGEGPSNNVISN